MTTGFRAKARPFHRDRATDLGASHQSDPTARLAGAAVVVLRPGSSRHVGQRGRLPVDLGEVAGPDRGAHAPRFLGCGHRRPAPPAREGARDADGGRRTTGAACPARRGTGARRRRLGSGAEARGSRGGPSSRMRPAPRGCRQSCLTPLAKTPQERAKLGRVHTVARARSAGKRVAIWATPPRSVDAPFVELHERHSTAVLAMSNGAPPAASGTT